MQFVGNRLSKFIYSAGTYRALAEHSIANPIFDSARPGG